MVRKAQHWRTELHEERRQLHAEVLQQRGSTTFLLAGMGALTLANLFQPGGPTMLAQMRALLVSGIPALTTSSAAAHATAAADECDAILSACDGRIEAHRELKDQIERTMSEIWERSALGESEYAGWAFLEGTAADEPEMRRLEVPAYG
jgi:hypothetical protein